MKKLFATFLSLQLILSPVVLAQDAGEMSTATPATEGKAIPYINMALGMGTGIIGTNIIMSCKMGASQPSLLVFMGGSLAYIAKEIIGAKGQSKATEDQINSIDVDNMQMDMLNQQKKSEEQNLKMIKGKKVWMIAITTIYTAATALAIIEKIMSLYPINKPDAAACGPGASVANQGVIQAIRLAYLSAGLYQTGKGIYDGVKSKNAVAIGGAAVMAATQGKKQVEGFFRVIKKTTATKETVIDKLLNNGILRAVTFGASAVLSGVIMADLMKQQKKTEDNISKMDALIANMKKTTSGNSAIDPGNGEVEDPTKNPVKPNDVKALADGAVPKHCWSNSSSSGNQYSEAGCANSIKVQKVTFPPSFNVPTLSAASNLTTDLAQAVSDGDMARADVLAGDLANMAARVKEVKDNLVKELNTKLQASGEKPVDLNKAIQDQVASLQKEMAAAAAAEGMTGGSAATVASEEKPKEETPAVTKVAAPEVVLPDAKIDFSEGETTLETPAAKTASLSDSLEEYESSEQDISNKSDVSIFKQVSNRYLLNYTRIFDKKKSLDESK